MLAGRVIVTGASGFIGRQLSLFLRANGAQVLGCVRRPDQALARCLPVWQGSLSSPEFRQVVRNFAPDWVMHCAGSSRVAASLENPQADYQQNVGLTDELYQALALIAPQARVVLLSSAAVYGQPALLPITEQTPIAPLSPYGRHKWQAEQLAAEWHQAAGLSTLVLRVFSAYGPGLRKQVLYDLYRKSQAAAAVELHGSGEEERDFVHIHDLCRVIGWAIEQSFSGFETLNVASGSAITIRGLAETFLQLLGWDGELRFSGEPTPGTPRIWRVAPERLEEYGLLPQIGLRPGLQDYLKWLNCGEETSHARGILAAAG